MDGWMDMKKKKKKKKKKKHLLQHAEYLFCSSYCKALTVIAVVSTVTLSYTTNSYS